MGLFVVVVDVPGEQGAADDASGDDGYADDERFDHASLHSLTILTRWVVWLMVCSPGFLDGVIVFWF